jgi:DNA-binding HxlR family transcriptional regulator
MLNLKATHRLLTTNKKVSMPRKENSTNSINEASQIRNCGVIYALSLIGGRWKPTILFSLLDSRQRYSVLKRSIEGISERMLVAQLRELEADGLVRRIVHAEVPPRVEYELTDKGRSAEKVLQELSSWGNHQRGRDVDLTFRIVI